MRTPSPIGPQIGSPRFRRGAQRGPSLWPDLPQPFTFLCLGSAIERVHRNPGLTRPLMIPGNGPSVPFSPLLRSNVLPPLVDGWRRAADGQYSLRFPLQPWSPVSVPGERPVGTIYSGDHPPPSHVDHVGHDLEGARRWSAEPRRLGSSPRKKDTPSFRAPAAGPWHLSGVPAPLDRKDGASWALCRRGMGNGWIVLYAMSASLWHCRWLL